MTPEDLRTFSRVARRRPLWEPQEEGRVSIGRWGIEKLLRHRDPFLLVDEITEVDLSQQRIRGRRYLDPAESILAGHFPGEPIYPGVLQLEMAAQLGGCLLQLLHQGSATITEETRPRDLRAMRVYSAEFLAPVRPGCQVTLLSRALEWDDLTAVCAGQILVDQSVCSWSVWEVYFVSAEGINL